MSANKTPGVYIQEADSFPPSIVGVDTAIPAFIGYTEIARDGDRRDLHIIPKKINSMAEYEAAFGRGHARKYCLATDGRDAGLADRSWGPFSFDGTVRYDLLEIGTVSFRLYNSMRMFFANGGGTCFVCSCGLYEIPPTAPGDAPTVNRPDLGALTEALDVIGAMVGPTMLVIPDAVSLENAASCSALAIAMLKQCQATGDRMALLDVCGTDKIVNDAFNDTIAQFRSGLAGTPNEALRYGAAYFPFLVTSLVSPTDIDITNFALDDVNKATLVDALSAVIRRTYPSPSPDEGGGAATVAPKGQSIIDKYITMIGASIDGAAATSEGNTPRLTHRELTNALIATVPGFRDLLDAIVATQNVLPPSGAIAGVWISNDTIDGVWNAPANIGIAGLISPSVRISDAQQEDLNIPPDGLAVNAIRTFPGRGNVVWGARTLDALSNDWRYIQVRRTMIYVEQSVKKGLQGVVFDPNTAQTWRSVTSMIENFLHGLWSAGGLMGARPAEAYAVRCGLGSTMTADDILQGVLRVQIALQMIRPAEYIEISFEQKMLGGM